MYTALTMAAEELRGLASSGAVDSPRQWQAVLEAAERVRAVLASLPQVAGWPSATPPFTSGSWPISPRGRNSRGTIATPATGRAALGRAAAAPPGMQTLVDRLRAAERVLTERGGGAPPAATTTSPATAHAAGPGATTAAAAATAGTAQPAGTSIPATPVDAGDGWPGEWSLDWSR